MAAGRKLRYAVAPRVGVDRRDTARILAEFNQRGRRFVRQRRRRLWTTGLIAAQAGLAGTLAWLAAAELLHTPEPVFAPVTAVGATVAALGRRLRFAIERVAGVVIGIGAGDLLVALVGTGPWQTGLAVMLAVYGSMLLTGSGQLVSQASGTAVLIGSLSVQNPDLELPRFLNAFVGGVVGLIVVVVLLPLNPRSLVERAIRPVLPRFAAQLRETAQALATGDADRAGRALDQTRDLDSRLERLHSALQGAREAVNLAPFHWHRREFLVRYEVGLKYLERAVESIRPLIRHSVRLLRDGEPVPRELATAVEKLGETLQELPREVRAGHDPKRVCESALAAARSAGEAYRTGVGFAGGVVVALIRTASTDLLRAVGVDRREAARLVRRAVHMKTRTHSRPKPADPG